MVLTEPKVRSWFDRERKDDRIISSHTGRRQVERMLLELYQKNIADRTVSHHVGYHRENGVTIIDAFGDELFLPPSIVTWYRVRHPSLPIYH